MGCEFNPFQIQADDLNSLMAEQGDACPTFNWQGTDYKILPGSAMYNQPLRDGGFSQVYDLAFTTTIAQFGNSNPASLKDSMLNTQFTYLGALYKITNVHILAGATMISIEANSLNQNA